MKLDRCDSLTVLEIFWFCITLGSFCRNIALFLQSCKLPVFGKLLFDFGCLEHHLLVSHCSVRSNVRG